MLENPPNNTYNKKKWNKIHVKNQFFFISSTHIFVVFIVSIIFSVHFCFPPRWIAYSLRQHNQILQLLAFWPNQHFVLWFAWMDKSSLSTLLQSVACSSFMLTQCQVCIICSAFPDEAHESQRTSGCNCRSKNSI